MITYQFIKKVESTFQNQATFIKNLETQVDQIANTIINLPQWTLSSDTKHILENESEEYYEAITFESGKQSIEIVKKPTPPNLLKKKIWGMKKLWGMKRVKMKIFKRKTLL